MDTQELIHPAIKPLVEQIVQLTGFRIVSAKRDGATAIDLFLKNDRASSHFGAQHKVRIVHAGGQWRLGVVDGLTPSEMRGLAALSLGINV